MQSYSLTNNAGRVGHFYMLVWFIGGLLTGLSMKLSTGSAEARPPAVEARWQNIPKPIFVVGDMVWVKTTDGVQHCHVVKGPAEDDTYLIQYGHEPLASNMYLKKGGELYFPSCGEQPPNNR